MAEEEEEEEAVEDEDEEEDADAEEEEEEEEAGEADLRRLAAGAGRRGIGECLTVCGGYVRGLGDEDVCVCGGVWGVVWCGRGAELV